MAGPSVRMGDAADRRAVGWAPVAGSDLDGSLAGSSVFFLPSPNKPRTLLFFGNLLADTLLGYRIEPCHSRSYLISFLRRCRLKWLCKGRHDLGGWPALQRCRTSKTHCGFGVALRLV